MSAQEIFSVKGKVAFITGAGGGLGRVFAEAMAENGADVSCFDIDPKGLAGTVERLEALGVKTLSRVGDAADKTAIERAVDDTVATFGKLDITFANAGVPDPKPSLLHEYDDANWKKVVDLNLNGVFYTDRAALRQMVKQGSGKLINIASMWGLAGSSSIFPIPAYTATKGAVVNLTRELALQYARNNIQVNAICPGFFMTNIGPRDEETLSKFTAFTPMGRMAEPDEIKGAALYLASSASSFVTGTALVIDGGCMAK
jgi:NAD(P)-dependent dehydrogenase (short-subunit alcohol dehydrogenase family)